MTRDDSGTTLGETLVVMVVAGMLLAGVLGMVYASAKLVQAAPSDTNPHVYGALATAVARLEDQATGQHTCTNPNGEKTRTNCLRTEGQAPTLVPHPDSATEHTECWVVGVGSGRRLECWELLPQGDLVAHRYEPDTAIVTDPDDWLNITDWLSDTDDIVLKASGLAHVEWNSSPQVTLESCAAIRPDQRQPMNPDDVPFCDGEIGLYLPDGSERTGTEGYPMPTLRVFS